MRILLLGGTGRTGKIALAYALQKGIEVNALVRDATKVSPAKGLNIIEGTPEHKEDLNKAIKGCEAIINILNISRKNDFPWSSLRTPERLLSETTKELIGLSKELKIQRIVSCSAWGVGDSRNEIPWWFKWTIDNSNISKAYIDHERQEELLEASQLNYTIVRPAGLINSKSLIKIQESIGGSPKPSLLITRQATAKFLVDALDRSDLERATVTISKA